MQVLVDAWIKYLEILCIVLYDMALSLSLTHTYAQCFSFYLHFTVRQARKIRPNWICNVKAVM